MPALPRAARPSRATVGRALALALCVALATHAAAAPTLLAPPRDLRVEEVVVGAKGYAVTAGPGDRLESFPVEVVGVLWEGGAGFPLVLVRASGPFIEASGGVAAGMSGSPVYLGTEGGDALLGAIGYVFPRADHDLALVTPIGVMREVLARPMPARFEVPGVGLAVPASTPVLLTGVSSRAAALLEPLFKDGSVVAFPVQGGGVERAAQAEAVRLVPGSALAVALAWGDVSLQAVGTVTTVENGRVLAFGHPFLGLGDVGLPIAPAHVTTVVRSAEVPFKLANVGSGVLGSIEQDRPGGIGGRLGVQPASLQVALRLVGLGDSAEQSFEVPLDDRLYPTLVGVGVLSLLDRYLGATTGGYAEVAWEIAMANGERVGVLEQTNDPTDIAYRAALLAMTPLTILATNEFQESAIKRVSLAIRLDDRQRIATLEEAIAEEARVLAGENVLVHLRLQPYRQAAIVRSISVPIPEDMEGAVTLYLRGGDVPRDTGDAYVDEKEVDRPRSYPELLDALRQQVQGSELVVEVVTGAGEVRRLLRTPFSFVVEGNERLTVTVEAPDEPAGPGEEAGGVPDE